MSKILKNTTVSDIAIFDCGITVPALDSYAINVQDYLLFAASADTVTSIASGDVVVNDGEDDLLNKRVAIALIQGNQPVLDEYYTLVEEDDVLVGNGQILYLNDELTTTDNVSAYLGLDEQIEDDNPTES
jgi:hypothetical protein